MGAKPAKYLRNTSAYEHTGPPPQNIPTAWCASTPEGNVLPKVLTPESVGSQSVRHQNIYTGQAGALAYHQPSTYLLEGLPL